MNKEFITIVKEGNDIKAVNGEGKTVSFHTICTNADFPKLAKEAIDTMYSCVNETKETILPQPQNYSEKYKEVFFEKCDFYKAGDQILLADDSSFDDTLGKLAVVIEKRGIYYNVDKVNSVICVTKEAIVGRLKPNVRLAKRKAKAGEFVIITNDQDVIPSVDGVPFYKKGDILGITYASADTNDVYFDRHGFSFDEGILPILHLSEYLVLEITAEDISSETEEDFIPHLELKNGTYCGKIGNTISQKDVCGAILQIGDIVDVFNRDGNLMYKNCVLMADLNNLERTINVCAVGPNGVTIPSEDLAKGFILLKRKHNLINHNSHINGVIYKQRP